MITVRARAVRKALNEHGVDKSQNQHIAQQQIELGTRVGTHDLRETTRLLSVQMCSQVKRHK